MPKFCGKKKLAIKQFCDQKKTNFEKFCDKKNQIIIIKSYLILTKVKKNKIFAFHLSILEKVSLKLYFGSSCAISFDIIFPLSDKTLLNTFERATKITVMAK